MRYMKVMALAATALTAGHPAAATSLEGLDPGWVLRARVNAEPPVTGRLVRRDASRITVNAGGAERELALAGLDGLEVRTSQTRRGALVGSRIRTWEPVPLR
ncbi:MAG TPA: hypothetical protein VJY35_02960 [Candidatus Eisenbacteria bacterium]|nr:hypothetical protein [Candidatus Eisenbacteria bacterium]